jgi:diaminohydroxyphosphoribosylaminopyrimidine deaminase/5-amino-6-(5-phosphoribosylamino)uracil reductase
MTTNHNHYLDLAFQLAEKNLGKTGLNPSVGTVIVKNKTIISSGITSINGRPHAEFNSLNKIKNFKGSDLYTSLEPCTHQGLTPPCTNIIIKKKIKNVYYASEDPDIRTFQKAKNILNKKGVSSKLIKSKNYKNFYRSYFFNHKFKVPFISAKIAISRDLFTINKKDKWITDKFSRKIGHLLRSQNDAIISTSKSINDDNSLLNCRIEGLNSFKPDLFIIDLNLKLKKNLALNKILKKRKTYIITDRSNIKKTENYKKKGYKIILIDSLSNKDDYNLLFRKLYQIGYSRILIEAGLTFINILIKNKLINDLYIFKSYKSLKKNGKNNDTVKYIKNILFNTKPKTLNDDKLYKKEF